MERLSLCKFDLLKVSESKYAAPYGNFTKARDYTVVVNAENQDGFAALVQMTITVPGAEAKPVDKFFDLVIGHLSKIRTCAA